MQFHNQKKYTPCHAHFSQETKFPRLHTGINQWKTSTIYPQPNSKEMLEHCWYPASMNYNTECRVKFHER